jgi:hypothetical protein
MNTPTPPSVGRVVHYVSYGTPGGEYRPVCRAAIVTEVPELLSEQPNSGPEGYVQAINIMVCNPKGVFFVTDVPYDAEQKPGGTWHWPERF